MMLIVANQTKKKFNILKIISLGTNTSFWKVKLTPLAKNDGHDLLNFHCNNNILKESSLVMLKGPTMVC